MSESLSEPPAASHASAVRGFLGRTSEFEALRSGLDGAVTGRGQLFLVTGEPGIGKTRLADEVAGVATTCGARALWGRCWEGGGAPSFWPWVQIVRAHTRELTPEVRAAQLRRWEVDLAPLLSDNAASLSNDPTAEINQTRFRLFDAAAQFLKSAAAIQPLVLILDDLHAADLPSLLLLQFLARELWDARLLVIGTYRDVEVRRTPALADVLGNIGREAQRIALTGLSASEVGRFIAQTAPQAFSPEIVAAVHRVTDGNPFFMDEVTRLLVAEGAGQPRFDPEAGPIAIPDGVRETIRRRLAPLAAGVRALLAAAAVIGREFDITVLNCIASSSTVPLIEALAEAMALGLVREEGTLGRYSFSHALVRETLRRDLLPAQRMQLHRAVGEALEGLAAQQAHPNIAQLAHHFFQAAANGGAEKAVGYAIRAGDQALQVLAYEEAATHYERALAALAFLAPDDARRCDLLLRLGEAQRRTEGESKVRSRDTFWRAAALARHLGDGVLLARAALGLARWEEKGITPDAVVALLNEALDGVGPDDSQWRARVLARLAMALCLSPTPERAAPLSAEAVAMARRVGDQAALAATLSARHFALWVPDATTERLQVADELIGVAEAIGDRDFASEGRLWRMVDRLEIGDGAGFHEEWEAMGRTARDLHLPVYRWHHAMLQTMYALAQGRLDDAERSAEQALAFGRQADIARAAQFYGAQLFHVRRYQGRLAEIEGPVRGFAQQRTALPIWRCALAWLCIELGQFNEARLIVDGLATNDFGQLPRDGNWLPSMAALSEVCTALESTVRAEQLYTLLQPLASHNVIVAEAIVYVGPVSYYLGILASTLQRWDDAAGHFEAALVTCRDFGATRLLADVQAAYDRLLQTRRPSDVAKPSAAPAAPPVLDHVPQLTDPRCGAGNAFQRDGDAWSVAFDGIELRLKDTRGLSYLHQLLSEPGREFPAIDLVVAAQGNDTVPTPETARVSVTKAIGVAFKALGKQNPALRHYFGNSIKTGRLCSYTPDPHRPVVWKL